MANEKNYYPFIWRATASSINMAGSGYQLAMDQGGTPISVLAAGNLAAALIYFSTNAYEAMKEYRKPTFVEKEQVRRNTQENTV